MQRRAGPSSHRPGSAPAVHGSPDPPRDRDPPRPARWIRRRLGRASLRFPCPCLACLPFCTVPSRPLVAPLPDPSKQRSAAQEPRIPGPGCRGPPPVSGASMRPRPRAAASGPGTAAAAPSFFFLLHADRMSVPSDFQDRSLGVCRPQ